MYQDLRTRLELYRTKQIARSEAPEQRKRDVDSLLEGTVLKNEGGSCFVIENHYYAGCTYGGCSFEKARNTNMQVLRSLYGESWNDSKPEDFLFLDTETTGLCTGAGTVAFLIGTGFFSGDSFVVRQFFMRDYDEESAALRALNELMQSKKGLVTFNGKAFDWNLLKSRYIFNRLRPVKVDPLHVDLLYPCRRIWRMKLESCRLKTLEEEVLEEARTDDIPGELIPSIYFKYLNDREASGIVKVVRHNELDILSMVSLLVRLCDILENPLQFTDGELELIGTAGIFEKTGNYEKLIDCCERCIGSGNRQVSHTAAKKLGDVYRRNKNYTMAFEHWKRISKNSGGLDIQALVEIAKHYEHRERDYRKALESTEKAVNVLAQTGLKDSAQFNELMKRLNRLRGKTSRVMKSIDRRAD